MAATGIPPRLDLYDVAFLAGGTARVVDTAVVALVESGRVRVHAPGELAVVQPGRSHPVEAALMDAIGTRGHRTVDTLRWRLTGDERLLDVERSLAAAGLVRRRRRLLRRKSRPAWSTSRAGRQALRGVRENPRTDPALDGGSASAVALEGRMAMPDAHRRAQIFERPVPPLPPTSGMHRRIREAGRRDVESTALRAQQSTALGGAATIGFLEGGAGDGGGF